MYLDLSVVPRMFIVVLFLSLVCAQSRSCLEIAFASSFSTFAFRLRSTGSLLKVLISENRRLIIKVKHPESVLKTEPHSLQIEDD
jgi:hypothetical protein